MHEAECDSSEGRNSSTTIVGYVNIPLSVMDRASRQKINKDGRLEQHYVSTRPNKIFI